MSGEEAVVTSPEEPVRSVQQVERARAYVWGGYSRSWIWYAEAVFLVGTGLLTDLAPEWAAVYLVVTAFVVLLVSALGRTRRGRVLLRLPTMPRSPALSSGRLGRKVSWPVLLGISSAAIGLGVGYVVIAPGGSGEHFEPPVPFTVIFLGLATIWIGISLAGRRWARRKMAGDDSG